MSERKTLPAVEGWFTMDRAEPHLLGSQCASCKTYFFPKETLFCRNPGCTGRELNEVPLSRRGTLWSFTTNHYEPPAPYVSPKPFVPYSVAAVELEKEKIVVLGQLARGVDPATLKVGTPMELVLEPLFEAEGVEQVVWKWRPARPGR
jgi:uncharacterized OB-fold protein